MMVQHSWGIRPETVMPLETLAQNSRITPWVTRCCSDHHKTNPNSWGVETDTDLTGTGGIITVIFADCLTTAALLFLGLSSFISFYLQVRAEAEPTG